MSSALLLLLSSGFVTSKSVDDALKEFVATIGKLGTGRCLPREFKGFLQKAKDCGKHKEYTASLHYCDALESSMHCYDHLESCYTGNNLDRFKAAAMELTVQTIGVFDDDFEDELQDCSIYTQLVGLKNSNKVLYVCIGVGLPIVLIGCLALYYRRRKSQTRLSSYNQTPLKTFQDA